jgi:fucose 4-O-acetylase-like acetyltransferase
LTAPLGPTALDRRSPSPPPDGSAPPGSDRAAGREAWVDVARGVAIALVVHHHVCMGLWTAGLPFWPPPGGPWYHALRPLRLPVLLFASGVLVERSLAGGVGRFVAKKVRRLGVPYAVWTAVFVALLAAFPQYANGGSADRQVTLGLAWGVSGPLQFLAWLLIAQLAYAGLRAANLGPIGTFAAAAAAAGVAAALPAAGATFGQPLGTLLALAAGAACGPLAGRVARLPPLVLTAILLGAGAGLAWAARLCAGPLTPGPLPAAALGALGVAVGVPAACLLARSAAAGPLAFLGRRSLEVLVAHTIAAAAARVLLARGLGVRDAAAHLALGTAVGVAVPLLVAAAARRVGLGWIYRG